MPMALLVNLGTALAYALLGVMVFIATFVIVDWWTPYDLWKEIVEGKNMALAMMVGLSSLGVSIIIAAAVHG
jgi:putative membrane protein